MCIKKFNREISKAYAYPSKSPKERNYHKTDFIIMMNDKMYIVNTRYDSFTRF